MPRKQGHNREIYEQKLRDVINHLLRQSISDPRLSRVSITRVELTQDYSIAKVYWDTFDTSNRGSIKEAVDGMATKMRSLVAKEIKIRHTPQIQLFYDSQFEDEKKITDILIAANSGNDDKNA